VEGTRPPAGRRKRIVRGVQVAVSLAVVAGVFVGILPKIASYSDVWMSLDELTQAELTSILAATAFNLWTYWLQMVAAMPGLTVAQAAVNNQTSTTVANLFPGGGAIAVGVTFPMFRSWGFPNSDITLLVTVTGVWNTFLKLGLPVAALGLVAATGGGSTLLIPALIGLGVLGAAVGMFAAMLWKEEMARAVGAWLGRAWSWLRRPFRKPPVTSWGEDAVAFRQQTIGLVSRRWLPITLTTLVSHLSLYFVLFLSLRHIGVSGAEIGWAEVLGVFAFVRLISAVPITPGGLGLVELGYIGGLVLAGREHADVPLPIFQAQVAAAVLLFRTLTYGIQIPLGGVTYLIWQRKKSWRKAVPSELVSTAADRGT
jgi:putative heme transporter